MPDSMNFTLSDEPTSRKKVHGTVAKEGESLAIYLDGFGNSEWPQGERPRSRFDAAGWPFETRHPAELQQRGPFHHGPRWS
jgi:hypothetical protein